MIKTVKGGFRQAKAMVVSMRQLKICLILLLAAVLLCACQSSSEAPSADIAACIALSDTSLFGIPVCSKDDILALKKERQKAFLSRIHAYLKPLGFAKKASKWTKKLPDGFVFEDEKLCYAPLESKVYRIVNLNWIPENIIEV